VFLHSYAERSWDDQLTKETLAERTIRAVVHAKKTLMAGFTSVRYDRCLFSENGSVPTSESMSEISEPKELKMLILLCENVSPGRLLSLLDLDTLLLIERLLRRVLMVRVSEVAVV
jgi:hypothetical protein